MNEYIGEHFWKYMEIADCWFIFRYFFDIDEEYDDYLDQLEIEWEHLSQFEDEVTIYLYNKVPHNELDEFGM